MTDRYIASVALQLWQRFFQLALSAGVVSNNEETWVKSRISALEYLARGKLMAVCSLFFDGPVVHEEGDLDLYQLAQRGVGVALGLGHDDPQLAQAARDELNSLLADIDGAERELEKLLADRCAYIAQQGPGAVALELARVPEMLPQHRAWLGSPIAEARGAVVAAEIERAAMPPTSSAPADPAGNQGFNPAFFVPGKQSLFARDVASGRPRAAPAPAAELEPGELAGGSEQPGGELEPPAAPPHAFNPNMTLFRPGKPA